MPTRIIALVLLQILLLAACSNPTATPPANTPALPPSTTAPTSAPLPTTAPPATFSATSTTTTTESPAATLTRDLQPAFEGDVNALDRPTQYTLNLNLTLPGTPTLTGTEDVSYTNRTAGPLNQIYFRLFANYPGGGAHASIANVTAGGQTVATTLEVQDTALRVDLPQPLASSQSVQMHLDFTITVPVSDTGHYADTTLTDGVLTLPSIYPLIPAYDSAGWHIELPPPYGDLVYADTSTYRVSVTAPATVTIAASGSTTSVQDRGDGTKTWEIVAAPARDFDLNASERWTKSTAAAGSVQVNAYAYDRNGADEVAKWASAATQLFSTLIGPYPYREFDVLETGTSAGGIEYPGLVVISDKLYDDPRQRGPFEFTVVHETAHQWFYGLVGDDQVNTPWMDESLVQYCTYIYFEKTYGVANADNLKRTLFERGYQQAKNEGHDKPIGLPVKDYTSENEYSQIVYNKGPLFFDALRKQMGDDAFFKFLKTYFQRYRYKNATPVDMLKTANEVSGIDNTALFQEWVGK